MAFVLTLAFVNGCATVISKMINYRCTKYLGTNNGSLVNYVVASVLSLILLLVSSRFSAASRTKNTMNGSRILRPVDSRLKRTTKSFWDLCGRAVFSAWVHQQPPVPDR